MKKRMRLNGTHSMGRKTFRDQQPVSMQRMKPVNSLQLIAFLGDKEAQSDLKNTEIVMRDPSPNRTTTK